MKNSGVDMLHYGPLVVFHFAVEHMTYSIWPTVTILKTTFNRWGGRPLPNTTFAAASTQQEAEMNKTNLTETFTPRGIHRRNFIKTAGIGAAGAAMIGTGVSLKPITAQAQTSLTLSKYTEQLPV